MNFVYPNFLWAFALLVIPVIIHLFNFRRYQTVYFSKVDLLNEAIEDSKSGNKLKHLLVLLSRLLAIAALVLAFAQPYMASKNIQNTETISSIYIDNSFSMQAQGQDGDLLNEVKNKAIELVSSFEENEKINLFTSDLLSKDQRFYTKSDIIDRIKEIGLSPSATSIESATNLQIDLLNKNTSQVDKRLFIFSDFQKSTSTIGSLIDSTILPFIYQPLAEVSGNVFIDSVWFSSPVQGINAQLDLFFRVKNLSDAPLENLTLTLVIDGKEKGVKSVTVGAQSFLEEKISYNHSTAGIKEGKLSIKTNQLFFDDQFYFTYDIKNETKILIVNPENMLKNSFEQLYGVDKFYNSTSVSINNVKQENFRDKALIILNGIDQLSSGSVNLLNSALENGATIVLIPGVNADLTSWNQYLSSKNQPVLGKVKSVNSTLKYFNDSDPLYEGVFEKKPDRYKAANILKQYQLYANNRQNFITLFGTQQSTPFLMYSNTDRNGRIILQTAPLTAEFTDFDKQALFAATYLRIAETATYQKSLFFTIGNPDSYSVKSMIDEKSPIHLKNEVYQFDVIPSTSISSIGQKIIFDKLDGNLVNAGFYQLTNLKDFNDKIAFNYSRAESETKRYDKAEILSLFKDKQWQNISYLELNKKGEIEISNIKPKEYWRLFLFLTLLFLIIEIGLLKWWKSS